MSDFGEKIKEFRLAKSWTQKELGEKIGLSQTSVYNWENNIKEPTISALKKLCEVFEVSADYLLGLTDGY